MNFYEEEVDYILELNNKLLRAAGVNETYFGINFLGDSYEVAVVQDNGKLRTWFHEWDEAFKYVKNIHRDANWEEAGW